MFPTLKMRREKTNDHLMYVNHMLQLEFLFLFNVVEVPNYSKQ